MREFALAKDTSLRVFWVGFGSKYLAWFACYLMVPPRPSTSENRFHLLFWNKLNRFLYMESRKTQIREVLKNVFASGIRTRCRSFGQFLQDFACGVANSVCQKKSFLQRGRTFFGEYLRGCASIVKNQVYRMKTGEKIMPRKTLFFRETKIANGRLNGHFFAKKHEFYKKAQ